MTTRPAVVTGASRGIGAATALLLAQRGVPCTLLGRRSEHLESSLAACNAHAPARFVECDSSNLASIERALPELLADPPPLALIHCAGVVERSLLEQLTWASYERQMNVNLTSVIWLTRGLLPAMRSAGSGRIVNVGSISASSGTARQCVYNASKWALTGFTKSLAEELRDSGLMTLIVQPGAVDTEMLRGSGYAPRMNALDVARTLVHYALDAPLAHNGAIVEMFGV